MRAACKHIVKANLRHNLKTLSALAPNAQCVAVVKANAYGSEATQVIDALSEADLFAVAEISEAMTLRAAGTDKPILLLEGVFEVAEFALAKAQHFEVVIATQQQLDWLLSGHYCFTRIWFKLDTGMGRLGFQEKKAPNAMAQLLSQYQQQTIVIMTHFSDADAIDRSITLNQIQRFRSFAKQYPGCQRSLCNSAGVLAYPDAHADFIRPGVALYGASPFIGHYGEDHDLKPVMTLTTRVSSIKAFKKGDPIGYGQTYRMEQDGLVAICEIGYADGYSRFIPSGTPILINGEEYPIIGRISMDMITVLVDKMVQIGDQVICWGEGLPIERICQYANTVPHQLLATVTERPKKDIR
ncbi:MAG: alanine racemase [Ostreibacterium sp.]